MNEEISHSSEIPVEPSHHKISSFPVSHHSKATTLIRKKVDDLEYEDDQPEDSQSSSQQTNQAQGQPKGLMKLGNSSIDMSFIKDINNECNYLITKFQQDQQVVQRIMNELRRKSGDISSSREREKLVDSKEDENSYKLLHGQKSSKTVTPTIVSKRIVPPLTQKAAAIHKNFKQHDVAISEAPTLTKNLNAASFYTQSNNQSEYHPIISAKNITSTNPNRLRHELLQDDKSTSVLIKNDHKLKEEGSQIQVMSRPNEDSSKFTLTDREGLTRYGETIQQTTTNRDHIVSFRQDGSHTLQRKSQDAQDSSRNPLQDGTAQFDLQNFNAFEAKVASESIVSSRVGDQQQFSMHVQSQRSNRYPMSIQEETYSQKNQEPDEYQEEQEEQYKEEDEGQDQEQEQEQEEEKEEKDEEEEDQVNQTINNSQIDKNESDNPRPIENFNDQLIYNRLPKNFFVNQDEEEEKDLNSVLSSIKQMRQDFLGYVKESNIQEKLDEISNIISPEKFFLRHFGEDEKTITSPPKSMRELSKRIQDSLEDEEPQKFINFNAKYEGGTRELEVLKQSNIDIIEERLLNPAIQEEEHESSPEKDNEYEDTSNKNSCNLPKKKIKSVKQSQRSKVKSAQESARDKFPKPAVLKIPDTSDYTGPRVLKMADYFKGSSQENLNPSDKPQSPLLNTSDDQISLNDQEKEVLRQKMESDILAKIDINFLFNKGDKLRIGLIDQHKAYKIMLKIKEVAFQQIE